MALVRRTLPCTFLIVAACSNGGSSSTPIGGAAVPPQLVACRSRIDSPFQFAEVAVRDGRNLGTHRVADRAGIERGVRVHPDGNTVVFARQRENGDEGSSEIVVSSIDGAVGEQRLTVDSTRDADPCWSPDGSRILFTSARTSAGSLFTMGRDGSDVVQFVTTPPGTADGEGDWNAATGRVVWSRRGVDGRHTLWTANSLGSGAAPLTDGGATAGAGSGDREPTFAPDGQRVLFVRRLSDELATLCVCDVATAAVTVLHAPNGDVAMPRWSPALDRVFFGLAEPEAGRPTLRLASLPVAGGVPTLLWPDQRWRLEGLALLPALPAAPAPGVATALDVTQAEVQIAAASSVFGTRSQLAALDGEEYALSTTTFEDREIGGINVKLDLPVLDASDVHELRVRIVARTSRAGEGSVLRSSIYNPVDERFDTAIELPAATTATTLELTTSSLRHVTAERQLRVTVIADLTPGDRADLRIDLVEVVLVAPAAD